MKIKLDKMKQYYTISQSLVHFDLLSQEIGIIVLDLYNGPFNSMQGGSYTKGQHFDKTAFL